jgi:hypothetical protein
MSDQKGQERRRTQRRPVLDTFSMFVVVPKKGMHRLRVHDISDLGLGFDLDTEGESFEDFKVSPKEKLEVHFYLNQSLYLPLMVEIARLETKNDVRRVGAELVDKSSRGYQAFLSFVKMLDTITGVAKIEE